MSPIPNFDFKDYGGLWSCDSLKRHLFHSHESNLWWDNKKEFGQGKNKKTQPQQSLGKGKNKKTQPQVEIQNEVAPEDNIAAQDVPNSSTGGLPPSDDRLSLIGAVLVRMGRKMEEFEKTQNEIKKSLKVIDSRLDRIDSRWNRIKSFFMKSKEIARK